MVRFGDHHLETDPHALVADLLRACQKAGMASEIGNVPQERIANVRHRIASLNRRGKIPFHWEVL
jgi:hypothetical protein